MDASDRIRFVLILRAEEFDPSVIGRAGRLRKGRKKKARQYIDMITAFDIEASRLVEIEQSVMYIWQFQIGKDITVIGRTWPEFFDLLMRIRDSISDGAWLVIYDFNLSYEFQFLKGLYMFEPDEVFCMDSRKVLRCDMFGCFEFRCAYLLTNMSLAQFTRKMGVENQKLSGEEFDYSIVRYPWTTLTRKEMQYCINDVQGLVQALEKQMKQDGDDLSSIPATSTGYVRRDVKKAMRNGFNFRQLRKMLPDVEIYKHLREAFRGGNTMSNRYWTDMIVENVSSHDIVSSYPSSLLTERYPMTPFVRERADVRVFRNLLKSGDIAILFRASFENIRLKDNLIGCPYIPRDKCRNLMSFTNSNGRILRASHLEITLTDVDFRIILSMYDWDGMRILSMYSSVYHMLPQAFRDVVMKYYRIKTELKGSPEDSEDHQFYQKNKEKLNAVYGMTVEDIARDRMVFENGQYVREDRPLSELIEQSNRKAFSCYQWGIWCTAHSRKRLQDGIRLCGKYAENFVYTDTDSIKSINDVDFSELNEQLKQKAIKTRAVALDRKGVPHYMGVWEDEDYPQPNRFKTLGAKKYVLDDGKNLHITIAGVDKRKGGKELGCLENFREGFVFSEAGGTDSIFNDDVDFVIEREGHKLRITDNLVIRDSTYTISLTDEYRDILNGVEEIRYSDHDIYGLYKVKK